MNVQELIDVLQAIEDKTLPVAVWADHGQHAMDAFSVETVAITDPDEYMKEGMLHPDDWEEYGVTEVNYVVIEG